MNSQKTVIISLSVGLAAILLWLVVWPSIQNTMAMREVLGEERKALEDLEHDLDLANEAQNFYLHHLTQEEADMVNAIISDYRNGPDTAGVLYGISGEGVSLGEVEISEIDLEIKNASAFEVSANLFGGYEAFRDFLLNMENSFRVFDIESITLSAGSRDVEDVPDVDNKLDMLPPIDFNITATAYYYDEGATGIEPGAQQEEDEEEVVEEEVDDPNAPRTRWGFVVPLELFDYWLEEMVDAGFELHTPTEVPDEWGRDNLFIR